MSTATVRDTHRSRVYAAEQMLRRVYDTGTTVTLHGITLQLEPEDRFSTLAAVQIYLDRVVSHPDVIAALGPHPRITVRERKGDRFAHYEYDTHTVAVNTSGTGWALRELVVLHELAHAYTPGARHGAAFTAAFITLVDAVLGPQAALALRLALD